MKEYINDLIIYFIIMSIFFSLWEKINQVFFNFIAGSVVLLMMHLIFS